jgi:cell division protein FtsB
MRNRRRKQVEVKKRRRRTVLFTIGILVSLYLFLTVIFGENGLLRYLGLQSVEEDIQLKIDGIERHNKELKRQIDVVKKRQDPNLIEELAREQGLTQEGEIIFQYEEGK